MRARFRLVIGIAVALGVTVSARQSAQTPPAQPAPSFGTRTEAVVVDVTVTDRKGRPVTTLTQSDFDVLEDNTPQKILTFERRSPEPGARADAAAAAAGVVGAGKPGSAAGALGPSVTALAFDHLSPEARNLAFQAAEHFVQHKQADELAGVFIVDQHLAIVAGYTTDASVLEGAVKKVAVTATTELGRERNGFFEQIHVPTDTPAVASAEEQGRADGDHPYVDPAAKAEAAGDHARVAEINAMIRMERSYQDMLTEVQGHASMDALLALVDSLAAVPGRKAVLYFCEGLTIPSSLEARFRSIILTANRSNVTVYTIDAAGLRVHSDQAATAQAVQEYGAMGVGDIERRDKFMNELEDNERALTKDPAVSLGILADQTGGLLVNNTNDLQSGVDRINQDRRNYYLLSYSSTNPAFDGTFHRIRVNVKKSGLDVRARSGYVAAPMTTVAPVADYEIPALRALTITPAPASFPFQIVAASVPVPGRPGLAVISATIPGTSLLLMGNQASGQYAGGAVIVARVLDEKGEVLRKLSQQYRLHGALAEVEAIKGKTLTFTRFPDLDPGRYRVEVAVYDTAGERASVQSQPLVIPPGGAPVVGDLLIVDHAERLPADQSSSQGNPLVVDGLLLKPVVNPVVHGKIATDVNFAVPLALVPGAALPTVSLALLSKGGASLAGSVSLVLGQPDPAGRLLAVGRIPLSGVPPGDYDLRVTVGAGADAQTRTAAITIAD